MVLDVDMWIALKIYDCQGNGGRMSYADLLEKADNRFDVVTIGNTVIALLKSGTIRVKWSTQNGKIGKYLVIHDDAKYTMR